jgi:hypothetical protein
MRTGSPRNISVKGEHDDEYGWFVLATSIPGVTIGAERAARQIVEAARYGDASLTITPLAQLGVAVEGVAPGLVAAVISCVNRLLPAPPGAAGDVEQRGSESRPAWLPRAATVLTDRAAVRNNEI